jgi:hypothetical protein
MGNYDNGLTTRFEETFATVRSAATGVVDRLQVEVVWATGNPFVQTGVMVPSTRNLANEIDYDTCVFCSVLCTNISASNVCAKRFFARTGNMTVGAASRSIPGNINATLSNVRFDEWDFGTDTAVTGGECIIVNAATISATF